MNPLKWKREHQVAGCLICIVGAVIGILIAWIGSPMYRLTSHSISGEWANPTRVFLLWLSHISLYWPWPLIGAFISGSIFYIRRILKDAC